MCVCACKLCVCVYVCVCVCLCACVCMHAFFFWPCILKHFGFLNATERKSWLRVPSNESVRSALVHRGYHEVSAFLSRCLCFASIVSLTHTHTHMNTLTHFFIHVFYSFKKKKTRAFFAKSKHCRIRRFLPCQRARSTVHDWLDLYW